MRKLFQESRGNFKPCVQTSHIHVLCTFYNLKRFILLSKQEIKITIHKTVVMITNSWQKYHKIILHASKSHGIELERKLYKKLRKNAQEHSYQEDKLAHIFFINFNMQYHHQTAKQVSRNS